MTYSTTQQVLAAAWKRTTATLPQDATSPARWINKDGQPQGNPLEYCLPPEHADLNLLPEVRTQTLDLFAELGIPWHAGVGDGPGNHLLSSQVQCANALGQMVTDPDRLVRAFGPFLDLGEVLQIEPGRYLTFEYIGPTDFFNEAPGSSRVRGSMCTSVDAAFLHRDSAGVTELVLVEWKYIESYRLRSATPAKTKTRTGRYLNAVQDPAGPVRADVLAFPLLLDEPFYQLMRQQLLAHALEVSGAEGASRVRVVHVSPPENTAYQASLVREEHRALGDTVSAVWHQLLDRPERFLSLDSAVFCDPEVTSREYGLRYADDVVHALPELLTALGLVDLDALEDVLDVEADVMVTDSGLELLQGQMGHVLDFPFRMSELHELTDELEA